MILNIKVIPNARKEKVERINNEEYKVWVKEEPVKGKANKAVQRILAEYFEVNRSCVDIKGIYSRHKKVVIKQVYA